MSESSQPIWKRLLWVVLIALPILFLVFSPLGRHWGVSSIFLLLILILNIFLLFRLFRTKPAPVEVIRPRMIFPEDQPAVVREVMDVCVATDEGGVRIFRGPLLEPANTAYEKLKAACGEDTVPMLQDDEKLGSAIFLMAEPIERVTLEKPSRPWLHWLLLALTLLTTIKAGADYQGIDLLREPHRFTVGLPYALGLIAILGCHELGHYFAARAHNMNVTPPFFIPVPFALGTFGAFIKMRSPPEDRTSLFDMAIAGPLAGFVIAIPTLIVGLRHSEVLRNVPAGLEHVGQMPSTSSLLFQMLGHFVLGPGVTDHDVVRLSPLAFAGSLGLLVTALNLIPVGQLDGGHITRAMFGTRAGATIARVAMLVLFLRAINEREYFVWALIVFFLARTVTPPMNDLTPISAGRRVLGWCSFIIFLLIVPIPDTWLPWLSHKLAAL